MTRPNPIPGQIFRHFKGKEYKILTLAHHSETDETLVVYQAQYEGHKVCARPLDMFMSEVDHEKYPEVEQQWRFELEDEKGRCVFIDIAELRDLEEIFVRYANVANSAYQKAASAAGDIRAIYDDAYYLQDKFCEKIWKAEHE